MILLLLPLQQMMLGLGLCYHITNTDATTTTNNTQHIRSQELGSRSYPATLHNVVSFAIGQAQAGMGNPKSALESMAVATV